MFTEYNFLRNERGSIGIMMGLVLPAIVGATAFAIEYNNAVHFRIEMQSAADVAAVSAATRNDKAVGEDIFRSRFAQSSADRNVIKSVKVKISNGIAKVEAQANAGKLFGNLGIGAGLLQVESHARAGETKSLDVVMALDYSGSMGTDNKYVRMADAAHKFLDSFPADTASSGKVRAGLVPFASYGLVQVAGRNLFDTFNGDNLMGADYLACVSNRGYPNSVTIDTPNTAVEASLWPAIDFAPITPGTGDSRVWAGDNSSEWGTPAPWSRPERRDVTRYEAGEYVTFVSSSTGNSETVFYPDGTSHDPADGAVTRTLLAFKSYISTGGTAITGSSNICEHEGAWRAGMCGPPASPPDYAGTSTSSTPSSESFASEDADLHAAVEELNGPCRAYFDRGLLVRPLTEDLERLKTDISAMTPRGATNIALGFDLSWHLLSENEPWVESAASEGAEKIAILLTDGVQTVRAQGAGNEYSISAANRNSLESCVAMKAAGVTVYTVAFGVNDTFTKRLLSECATSLNHYFEPGAGADLDEVFGDIAKSLKSPAKIIR